MCSASGLSMSRSCLSERERERFSLPQCSDGLMFSEGCFCLWERDSRRYLVHEPSRHQPLEVVEVERSSLVAVVLVENGCHLFLYRVLTQRQQGLFQLDLQHQTVSVAIEQLFLQAVERPRHRSGFGRVDLYMSNGVKEPASQLMVKQLNYYTK